MHHFDSESQSHTTKTNIHKFFDGGYVPSGRTYNLIIVSSTFHLIRLGKELKLLLRESTPHTKPAFVVLVGAEDASKRFLISDVEYIKLMMFDIFDYLVRQTLRSRTTAALSF